MVRLVNLYGLHLHVCTPQKTFMNFICNALIRRKEYNKLTAQIHLSAVVFEASFFFFHIDVLVLVGSGNAVGIATRYGLDGPGIESLWGRDFPHPSRPDRAHPTSFTMGTGSFPGLKRPGRGVHHLPHLASRLKDE